MSAEHTVGIESGDLSVNNYLWRIFRFCNCWEQCISLDVLSNASREELVEFALCQHSIPYWERMIVEKKNDYQNAEKFLKGGSREWKLKYFADDIETYKDFIQHYMQSTKQLAAGTAAMYDSLPGGAVEEKRKYLKSPNKFEEMFGEKYRVINDAFGYETEEINAGKRRIELAEEIASYLETLTERQKKELLAKAIEFEQKLTAYCQDREQAKHERYTGMIDLITPWRTDVYRNDDVLLEESAHGFLGTVKKMALKCLVEKVKPHKCVVPGKVAELKSTAPERFIKEFQYDFLSRLVSAKARLVELKRRQFMDEQSKLDVSRF